MKPKFEFKGIKPAFINGGLRAFVQTVLPTIYDDSLSYYELLNKVVKHLNNVVSDVATLNTNQENFISAVTNFINETAVETYDVDITNPLDPAQLQLSADDTTALFNAIENDKIVRVFVHSASGTIYTCYYYTIVPNDNEQNNLYFAGFSFSQYDTNPNIVPWKIVKIKRSGAITIYDNVNAVTKNYVDESINNATGTLAERIDALVEKAPYKVYFDVYPDPNNARQYIVASDETPLGLSMIDAQGNDIECYMVSKASAEGIVIDTVKADTVVFGQSSIYITFDHVNYNPNEPTNTIYKKGYNVIHGNKTDNEWAYQAFAKTSGKVEFNITMGENNHATITSFSHTPEEVYRLFSDYGGYVPCEIYFNSPLPGSGVNYSTHAKTNAIVSVIDGDQNWFVSVSYNELTNGRSALDIAHYLISGSSNDNTWSMEFSAYEYPAPPINMLVVGGSVHEGVVTLNKTASEIYSAMIDKTVVVALTNPTQELAAFRSVLYTVTVSKTNNIDYYTFNGHGITTTPVRGSEHPSYSLQ